MVKNLIYRKRFLYFVFVMTSLIMVGCNKNTTLAEDPYAGGKELLDITFKTKTTDPEIVPVGSILNLEVSGLMKYKDSFKVFVNEIESEVITFTDSTLRFRVPTSASTGSVWITAEGQTFFGPIVKIGGKVSVDGTFKIVNGAGRLTAGGPTTVFDIEQLPNNRLWVVGAFDNFELKGTEAKPNGGIAQLDPDGGYITTDINFGIGVDGGNKAIYSVNRITSGTHNGKYIISGSFTAYNSKKANRKTINNIVMLTAKGELDSIVTTEITNPKPEVVWKNKDTIPTFNGGVDGVIRKSILFGEKIYVIGNFQNYKRIYYPNSTYDEKVYDVTRMLQLVRLNLDGSMDSTFHYNPATRQSAAAANGAISDAIVQSDGKLILVGNFTSFNGVMANRIVRLNLDGSVDPSFLTGSGADGDIYSIRYNANTQKIVLSGTFNVFNGKSSSGVALLNSDGSNNSNFEGKKVSGGAVTFAAQLNNGKIIVTGSFNKYEDTLRQGFMILESNGTLSAGYNNTGGFEGRVYNMIESAVSGGTKVILVGDIFRFNSMLPKNVLRIMIAN